MSRPCYGATIPGMASSGSFDHARRRKSTRKQRERGCSIYIPAEVLQAVGWPEGSPPPFYRVWAGRRGGLTVRLYREG